MMKKILLIFSISLAIIGCDALTGKEVARLPINETSNINLNMKEATLFLKKDEKVSFWTETDIEYENDVALVYTIELWKDSIKLGGVQLDALETNPTILEIKSSKGNKTSWSYTGKMDQYVVEEDGEYTYKAVLSSSDNPTLKINKAELVLKK
ncbi:hypothetical protein [Persicobacter diffluens]|uniref:Lipoprotein n=1 Tax=Persicobacter diffluens TaxID=981 RepID=A0AAN5ALD1_9BACT|nr:hypothetical protein PEDI_13000 [Persicobacter diffluens]